LQEQGVERVFHPSLQPGWQATLTAGGPMLSFVVTGGDARAERLLQALKVATPATSLGGVETLVSLPYNTSHRTPEARAQIGLLPGTVRLSVGIEAFEDLRDDLAQALAASA
jgi:cystathionine beta-lyase/cystathionine gamma-synthase